MARGLVPRLRIRTKVLLVALVLAAIPLVGYGYVREIEKVLRAAHEQAVIATSRAAAAALHDRPGLLARRADADDPSSVRRAGNAEVELVIQGLRRAGSRIWVIDQERNLLALEGSLRGEPATDAVPDGLWGRFEAAVLRPMYALLLERPREDFDDALPESVLSAGRAVDAALAGAPATRWRQTPDRRAVVLAAAHPIWNGTEVVGAVIAEETTNSVLTLRNRVLEQLLTVTLATFVLGAGTLLLFASRLSARLRRLRDDAEDAIDAQGRVRKPLRAMDDGDEIGDLSRSFATLLGRLRDYTEYLERIADRLSHELRTPIAVVSSSLDNLRTQPLPDASRVYIERAEDGVRRLDTILTRISEATRLERMLVDAEREPFDLGRVVSGCVAGYAGAFPQARFALRLPERRVRVVGSPDLVAQMLDKLVANAVDFSAPDEPIEVSLDEAAHGATLAVSNIGPRLPEAMRGRLFESMVSMRPGGTPRDEPHLGLGLFIVRLIAQFHGGRALARDRADGRGVAIEVELPATRG
jgi:dedicated sortase system histidine kinase